MQDKARLATHVAGTSALEALTALHKHAIRAVAASSEAGLAHCYSLTPYKTRNPIQ
jgi:hypothetical protein